MLINYGRKSLYFCRACKKVPKLTQQLLQVLINYGRKSNEQLLLYYGFSMRDNAADSVMLSLPQAQVQRERERASERASERESARSRCS